MNGLLVLSSNGANEQKEQRINELIDRLHFRTFDKVYDSVKNEFPTITKKDLRKLLMKRKKDKHLKNKQVKPYQIKIYSPTLNCWQMDLLDNGKNHVPRYWHVFIGVNNRYAVTQAINSKDAEDVRQSLLNFILEYHPVKLTSDQEASFMEKQNVQMLTDMKVILQTVPEQNHSTLSIIDRFIRTLRDMNRPTDGDNKQSDDEKFKYFDMNTMINLIYSYNNTYHSSIKCTPKEMFDDKEKEKEYIFKCMDKSEKQKTIKDFELKDGQFVRFVIARDPMMKKRYHVSNESYKIVGKEGKHYILQAKDGSTMIKPRFQLVVTDKEKYKWANKIEGSNKMLLKEILSFDKQHNKYRVKFSKPNGRDTISTIPVSFVRGRFPQKMTEMEKEYFKNQGSSTPEPKAHPE